jgi:ABC-2 type transport system ATP-binding protein
MLCALSLGDVSKSKAKTLSGGMQRRLSIAMALISDPKILFLDEPTLGLDVIARRELWSTVKKLKGRATIILTTHYMEEAQALSDRIGIMSKGELKAVGTAQELMEMTKKDNFEETFITIAAETEVGI